MADMTREHLEAIVTDCVGRRRGAGPAVDAIMLAADQYAAEVALGTAEIVAKTTARAVAALLADPVRPDDRA